MLRVESRATHMNKCEVQSGHAALFSPYGLRLMNYFRSMWEACHNRCLAASQDTLIRIDSRFKEANEKLIKRKYVLTRGASGVLLYTQRPVRYM